MPTPKGTFTKGCRSEPALPFRRTKVQLVINLRTAKTLDITIPMPLIGLADEVIDEGSPLGG
jgi:hypothetical protein